MGLRNLKIEEAAPNTLAEKEMNERLNYKKRLPA